MSLVNDAMEKTYIMDKTTTPDGYGGVITKYVEGAEILVAYSFNTSTDAFISDGISTRQVQSRTGK